MPVAARLRPAIAAGKPEANANSGGFLMSVITAAKLGRTMVITVVAWLALAQGQAHAQGLTCNSPNPAVFNFQLPVGTFAVPRDAPVGTRISPWTSRQTAGRQTWRCTVPADVNIGPAYRAGLPRAGQLHYSEGGESFPVFTTNVQGVGLVIGVNSGAGGNWYGGDNARLHGVPTNWEVAVGTTSSSRQPMGFGTRMSFAFVKTGPITAGAVNLPGAVLQVGIDAMYDGNPQAIVDVRASGSPTFSEVACTTPNVNVNMGTRSHTDFQGVGSAAPATAFTIDVNNCPGGLNGIQYRVDAVTQVLNSANSVVALDGNSNAQGIGVQLLDGAGAVLPLGVDKPFTGYNRTSGGSYKIPLKARYYKTGEVIRGGTANTAMTFTMTYQ
jgi:major type 1 subunit fimbrin (pilin)